MVTRQRSRPQNNKKHQRSQGQRSGRRLRKFSTGERLGQWLELRGVAPSYGGGLLVFFTVFFFGAATNTMAGWLYVISGVLVALLLMAAILSRRSLRGLSVTRQVIAPVSVGDTVTVTATYHNGSDQPLTLSQGVDCSPLGILLPATSAGASQDRKQLKERRNQSTQLLEKLEPGHSRTLDFTYGDAQRGVYCWTDIALRTAAPLGLLWAQRRWSIPAKAVVYPQILPLNRCPLVDHMGQGNTLRIADRDQFSQASYEGLTRSLRPYRTGDPLRLVHWRTSARYGELQVRELETTTSGQMVTICMAIAAQWDPDDFERAASAAASIYSYASRRQLDAQLWMPSTGVVHGRRAILETLAAINPGDRPDPSKPEQSTPPKMPLLWLTANPDDLTGLPAGSRWLLWGDRPAPATAHSGYSLKGDQPLDQQLEATLPHTL